ncbi:hypothetical protein D3C87_1589810 [compost metagenome]
MNDQEEKRIPVLSQFALDLCRLTYRTGAPLNNTEAAKVAAQLEELGYRKFEIVEEDV